MSINQEIKQKFNKVCGKPKKIRLSKTQHQKLKTKLSKTIEIKFLACSPSNKHSPLRAAFQKFSPFLTGMAKGSLLGAEAVKLG